MKTISPPGYHHKFSLSIYIYIFIYVCIYICIYTYIFIFIYTYIYIYIFKIKNISTSTKPIDNPDRGAGGYNFFTLEKSGQNKAFPRKFCNMVLHPLKVPRP